MTTIIDDLSIEYFDEGGAALYMGNARAALVAWIEPGYTQIALFETIDGQEICHDGHCKQSLKAHDICWRWIAEGTASLDFRPYESARRAGNTTTGGAT